VLQVLDAAAVRRWAARALDALGREREHIDALNVFPVPDGDTGTNLFLTIEAACQAIDELGVERDDFGATMRALAHGAFFGARGNSGVIVSQILRGMSDAVVAEPAPRDSMAACRSMPSTGAPASSTRGPRSGERFARSANAWLASEAYSRGGTCQNAPSSGNTSLPLTRGASRRRATR